VRRRLVACILSVQASPSKRRAAWERLSTVVNRQKLQSITTTVGLEDVVASSSTILSGNVRGRPVIDVMA
jgi:acrylyl-CoA reductase (NADPH)